MEANEYHERLLNLISESPYAQIVRLNLSAGAEDNCYVRGWVRLLSGHTLHIAEYLKLKPNLVLIKYRYQVLDAEQQRRLPVGQCSPSPRDFHLSASRAFG